MLNVKGVLSSCVFIGVAIASSTLQRSITVAAQPVAQAQASWTGVVDMIFGRKEPRDPGPARRGGTRTPDLCWITPIDTVWNTRPLFVWQGDTRLIGVRRKDQETVLWQQVASIKQDLTEQSLARYFVEPKVPLQPGDYEWLFFDSTTRSLKLRVPFQVMNQKERTSIQTDLTKLNAELRTAGAGAEEIARQRADFFADRKLWSDAIQEVYSVKKPSAELQQVAQKIEKEVCESKK